MFVIGVLPALLLYIRSQVKESPVWETGRARPIAERGNLLRAFLNKPPRAARNRADLGYRLAKIRVRQETVVRVEDASKHMNTEDRPSARLVLLVAALITAAALGTTTPAGAGVTALPLPQGFTIAPEADRRLVKIGADGTVYAIANRIDMPDRTAALRWRANQRPEFFVPIPQTYDDDGASAPRIDAIAPNGDAAYITVARAFDGAYMGTRHSINRWLGNHAESWTPPECASVGYNSPHVYAVDPGRIALTIDPSSSSTGIDLQDPRSVAQNLPSAVLLEKTGCSWIGTAILTGVTGPRVIGYIGYLSGKPAPWFVNLMEQDMMAIRWFHGKEQDLGPGVPFAVTATGFAVGASTLPGHAAESMTTNFFGRTGTYVFPAPHAVLWSTQGKRVALFRSDARSVAWDANEGGTIVGMMQNAAGRHYAFSYVRGHVHLLDDLPHPPGWRFEAAYAVSADGTIAGTGTLNGIAAAFLWHS
jgi:hypothetical protein